MIYSKKMACFILIFLSVLTLSEAAKAQNIDNLKIQTALKWTDEIIRESEEIVNKSRSQKARVTWEKAFALQSRAYREANSGNFNDYHKNTIAYKLTMEARNQAKRAIALAKIETRMVEKHRMVFERTRERLINLNGRIIETGIEDMKTRKLIRDSNLMLEKSHTHITQMRTQLAFNLTLNAQKLVSRAENRFRKVNSLRKMCLRRLSLMKGLTSRAGNRVEDSADQKSRARLAMAESQLEKAKSFFREGRYNACRISILKSEKIMRSLINNINPTGKNQVDNMLKQTWQFYEKTREAIEASGQSSGNRFLKQAEKTLQQAEKKIENGNPDQAKKLIIRARSTLREASTAAVSNLSKEKIEAKLEKLKIKNTDMKIVIENCSRDESKTLYRRAIKHLDKAHEHLRNGNLKSAFAEVRITNNLFDRITEICSI